MVKGLQGLQAWAHGAPVCGDECSRVVGVGGEPGVTWLSGRAGVCRVGCAWVQFGVK